MPQACALGHHAGKDPSKCHRLVVLGHPAGKAPSNCCRPEVQAPVHVEGPPAELSSCLMGLPGPKADAGPVQPLSPALAYCVSKDTMGLRPAKLGDALFRGGVL